MLYQEYFYVIQEMPFIFKNRRRKYYLQCKCNFVCTYAAFKSKCFALIIKFLFSNRRSITLFKYLCNYSLIINCIFLPVNLTNSNVRLSDTKTDFLFLSFEIVHFHIIYSKLLRKLFDSWHVMYLIFIQIKLTHSA